MNELELRHLRCVVTLAQERNFGRAAARLHMSQPPLTRIVADVERIVGARLFERTTRRVDLTPTGEVFVAEAQATLARADTALQNIQAAVRRQSGQLRLAYTPLALLTVLPRIVASLREREHDVRVDLIELTGEAQREALERGEADMGFADEAIETENLCSLLLHREALQIVVPENHPLTKSEAINITDLKSETLILHQRHDYPHYYDGVIGACQKAGFTPKVYHREARQNCLALVTAGQGVLLAPAQMQHERIAGLRCLALSVDDGMLCTEVWAVFATTTGSPHLETLRAVVQAHTKSFPYLLTRVDDLR